MLVPVSSNALVYYIKSINFSNEDWLERTQRNMKITKVQEILRLTGKPSGDCEILYDRHKLN